MKKSVFHPGTADGEDWYKFDDDKVSIFPKEKLGTLDGGGAFLLHFCLSHPPHDVLLRGGLGSIRPIVQEQASGLRSTYYVYILMLQFGINDPLPCLNLEDCMSADIISFASEQTSIFVAAYTKGVWLQSPT